MLYKLQNGKLLVCNKNGVIDNNAVSNIDSYLKNNLDIAKKEGYKPLVNKPFPKYDSKTEYVKCEYKDLGDVIDVIFTVEKY